MNLWWYTARAGGLVAWALLAGSVGWGLVLSSRAFRSRPRPAWVLDIHRFLGGLAVLFTAVHVAALVADSYVHFGPAEVLVPLAGKWHPVGVAWGVVSMYLLIAIEGTSLAMRKLPQRAWRAIHRTSFVLFVFASIHAIVSGTDARSRAVQWLALGALGGTSFLWLLRGLTRTAGASRRHASRPTEPYSLRSKV